jgi:hypothetical protein
MRLPSVSLFFAAGILLPLFCMVAEASEPVMVSNCMDLAEPRNSEVVAAAPAATEVVPVAAEKVVPEAAEKVAPEAALPSPVPTPLDARHLADERTYRDVFRILSTPNPCSDFYGGPAKASTAFNQFARQLKRGRLDDPKIALRMSGNYTNYQDHATGVAYRIFDRATINTDGPVTGRAVSMQVGRYPGHTPQARALVLLHELGHLVREPNGDWLLANDGDDIEKSTRNTRVVEAHCAEQLKAIRD